VAAAVHPVEDGVGFALLPGPAHDVGPDGFVDEVVAPVHLGLVGHGLLGRFEVPTEDPADQRYVASGVGHHRVGGAVDGDGGDPPVVVAAGPSGGEGHRAHGPDGGVGLAGQQGREHRPVRHAGGEDLVGLAAQGIDQGPEDALDDGHVALGQRVRSGVGGP
jgi:hypothetical protein